MLEIESWRDLQGARLSEEPRSLTKLDLISQSSSMAATWMQRVDEYFAGDGLTTYDIWDWVPNVEGSHECVDVHSELGRLALQIQQVSISSRAEFDEWEVNVKKVLVR